MAETKPSDQADKPLRAPEVKPLGSSDAQQVATPTAQDKQIAEADRTNQSSGSLTELALKTRGLTREQIAAQMEAQGDSVSIDYGNGQEASRKTGLTEKSLVQVGGKTYDAKTVVAYELQKSSDIVSDATNATAPVKEQDKITLKPVEVAPTMIRAGLDYNEDRVPFGQKLANFVQSAEARLMDPEGQKAYVQGLIDKVIGVGRGLNEAKDEVKTTAAIAATKAWTALNDGSVASFLAQPNAINEPLFKTLGTCFDAMRKDPNAVNNVLAIMGRELEAANDKYTKMTPQERGVQDGKAMFWFINPAGSTEAADLALVRLEPVIAPVDAALNQTIERSVQAIKEMAKTSVEAAEQTKQMLLDYLNGEGLYGRKLAGIPDGFFDGMKPTEKAKIPDTVNAMVEHSEERTKGYRGDKDPWSKVNEKGDPKAHIDHEGNLTPVDPAGIYKGRKVELYEHINHKFCRHAKRHTPYISFGTSDGVVAKYGNEAGIELDLERFRQAIEKGELPGRKIHEHQEVLDSIEGSHYPPRVKTLLAKFVKADKEILVEGVIPKRFLRFKK